MSDSSLPFRPCHRRGGRGRPPHRRGGGDRPASIASHAREPVVGAWQYLDREQALAEARRRDAGPPSGPLHGVPIAVKDLIDTVDMPTAYGSPIYARPPSGGGRRLRRARARAPARSSSARPSRPNSPASRPARPRNPHNPAHTPGGSSSGSAAAVADGMAPLAFGTQTAGSVIRPGALLRLRRLQAELWRDPARRGQDARRQPRHDRRLWRGPSRMRRSLPACWPSGPALRHLAVPQRRPVSGSTERRCGPRPSRATIAALDRARTVLERAGASVAEIAVPPEHKG